MNICRYSKLEMRDVLMCRDCKCMKCDNNFKKMLNVAKLETKTTLSRCRVVSGHALEKFPFLNFILFFNFLGREASILPLLVQSPEYIYCALIETLFEIQKDVVGAWTAASCQRLRVFPDTIFWNVSDVNQWSSR